MGHEQLGRLAILPPYRKYGFGRVLVQGVHDWARSQLKGPDEKVQVVLHSQVRPPFFSTSSFRRSDEELMDV
jgi:GNAT superfamily N-acetyltransferase